MSIKRTKYIDLNDIIKARKGAEKAGVKWGFIDGQYPNGASVASVAIYNEFGTEDETGQQAIPERPFFRTSNAENKEKYKSIIKHAAREGKYKKGLQIAAVSGVNDVQNSIIS